MKIRAPHGFVAHLFNFFGLSSFFLSSLAAFASGGAQPQIALRARSFPADEAMPAPMVFKHDRLDMAVNIIAARLGLSVQIESGGDRPVSGDYSHTNLRDALDDLTAQAGLVVIDEGAAGLHIVARSNLPADRGNGLRASFQPVDGVPTGKSAAELAAERQIADKLRADQEKRVQLLRAQAALLQQAVPQ
jgi:hypothetical protein